MNKSDPLSMATIDCFVRILGSEAGNFALKALPSGGLYLVGGISVGLREHILNKNVFRNAFY